MVSRGNYPAFFSRNAYRDVQSTIYRIQVVYPIVLSIALELPIEFAMECIQLLCFACSIHVGKTDSMIFHLVHHHQIIMKSLLWMEEILHQLVDGLSHCNPIIYIIYNAS